MHANLRLVTVILAIGIALAADERIVTGYGYRHTQEEFAAEAKGSLRSTD